MSKSTEEIVDIEIVADVVRLARGAKPGKRGTAIFRDIRNMHPDVEEIRIRQACGKAADLLLAQHS